MLALYTLNTKNTKLIYSPYKVSFINLSTSFVNIFLMKEWFHSSILSYSPSLSISFLEFTLRSPVLLGKPIEDSLQISFIFTHLSNFQSKHLFIHYAHSYPPNLYVYLLAIHLPTCISIHHRSSQPIFTECSLVLSME
jgi:hypothetical protein